jgi:(p)ppGpp synthase/HD superfamily hydrolase
MDEVAEQGFAAHWKYKDGVEEEYTEDENELNDWLRTIKEILDDPQPDAMDFLDTIKLNLFASEIFVLPLRARSGRYQPIAQPSTSHSPSTPSSAATV